MLFVSAIAGMLLVLIGVLLFLSLVDYVIWRNDSEDSEQSFARRSR